MSKSFFIIQITDVILTDNYVRLAEPREYEENITKVTLDEEDGTHPLTVRPVVMEDGSVKYKLVNGHMRYQCLKDLISDASWAKTDLRVVMG